MADWLSMSVLGLVPLWFLLVVALAIFGYVLYKKRNSTTSDGKAARRISAVFAAVLVGVLIFGVIPQGGITPVHAAAALLSLSETASGSCYDFPDLSGDGACNPASPTTDIVVNDADKTITLGVTSDYSANALYALSTTTAYDKFGITFTVRRTDDGWRENGQVVSLAVSGSISGVSSWSRVGNVTNRPTDLIAKNAQQVFQIAWTDESSNTIVGQEDAGGLAMLAPAGDSAVIRLTVAYDESAVPRAFQFATYTFSATIVISIDQGPSFSIPVTLTLQSQA